MTRLYKSGSRFAFWRWTFTPSGYLTRLFLIHTPWGGVMVHFINGPDPESDPHNHPVTFLSLILRGAYCQQEWQLYEGAVSPIDGDCTACSLHSRYPIQGSMKRWFNFVRALETIHRIQWVAPGTVTLVFYGPKRGDWGFFTQDGWVYWKDYNKKYLTPDIRNGFDRTGNPA